MVRGNGAFLGESSANFANYLGVLKKGVAETEATATPLAGPSSVVVGEGPLIEHARFWQATDNCT